MKRVGDLVEVISDCMTNGCKGEIVKIKQQPTRIMVQLYNVPMYITNDVVTYSPKSLKVLQSIVDNDDKCSDETKQSINIGVVFEHPHIESDLNTEGFSDTDEYVVIIMAHSKEHCIKKLNKLIDDGKVDWGCCDYLAFGGKIYELCVRQNVKIMEN